MGFISGLFGGGGGGSTTTVEDRELTPEELALITQQTELAEFQLSELKRQAELQDAQTAGFDLLIPSLLEAQGLQATTESNPEFTKLRAGIDKINALIGVGGDAEVRPTSPITISPDVDFGDQTGLGGFIGAFLPALAERGVFGEATTLSTEEAQKLFDERQALRSQFGDTEERLTTGFERAPLSEEEQQRKDDLDELFQIELENIRRGDGASPQQLKLIQEAADAGIALGESDISRFQEEATGRLAEELAPSLGLRPTDTPIVDRAGRIGAEATRQQGQLVRGLRGAQAQATLNFPLASQALQSSQAQFQQNLGQATTQFQSQLQNAAFLNRLRLSQGQQQLGLGLATGFQPNIAGTLSALGGAAGGSSTTTQGASLGGIGSLLSGIGALGGLFEISSCELKRDPEGIGLSSKDQSVDLVEDGDGVYRPARQIDHEKTLAKVEELPVERWRYKEGLGLGDQDHLGPYAQDVKEGFGVGDGETISVIDAIGIGLSATKGLAARVHKIEHGIGLAGA